MLRTVTVDLDYALEMLLPYFFIIKDLCGISSEQTKQCMLDGGIAYDRTVSTFRGEG